MMRDLPLEAKERRRLRRIMCTIYDCPPHQIAPEHADWLDEIWWHATTPLRALRKRRNDISRDLP